MAAQAPHCGGGGKAKCPTMQVGADWGAGVLLGEQLPLKHNTRTRRIEGLLVGGKECIVERNYLIFQRSAAWYAAWYAAAAVTLNAKLVTQHSSWDNAMMYGGESRGGKVRK